MSCPENPLPAGARCSFQRQPHFSLSAALGLLIAATSLSALAASPTLDAGAVVLVNSASARYLDFRNYIQAYLDHFGVPYRTLDILTNAVGAEIDRTALIIIGHPQLDPNHTLLDAVEQAHLVAAVSNGCGLVNFDYELSEAPVVGNYQYVQSLFNFTYTPLSSQFVGMTYPVSETGGRFHYIAALHTNGESMKLYSPIILSGFSFGTNVTAVALSGARPFIMVTSFGNGRAVQFAGNNWMSTSVHGPMAGLDDLVWRSLVWAARKPFVLRGMPNFVTMRVDDTEGPHWYVPIANEFGITPWLGPFINSMPSTNYSELRQLVANGRATATVHAFAAGDFLLWNHFASANFSDLEISNRFFVATRWHQTNGIPISKVIVPHTSEVGPNAFPWLASWGVEYLTVKNTPGTARPSPWLIAGPFRKYEPQMLGTSGLPLFYADFLTIPGHPELDGKFFNCVTEIRDDANCLEWCPSPDVPGSIGRGVRQLRRAYDSMALGTLYTHEYCLHHSSTDTRFPPIPPQNWRATLQGITNGLAGYPLRYTTLDEACQYVRATRTATLTAANYDPQTREVLLQLSGKSDTALEVKVFVNDGNAITNFCAAVPPFTNSIQVTASVIPRPLLSVTLQTGQLLLSFSAEPGRYYSIEKAGIPGQWSPLFNFTAETSSPAFIVPLTPTQQFYRVRTPLP